MEGGERILLFPRAPSLISSSHKSNISFKAMLKSLIKSNSKVVGRPRDTSRRYLLAMMPTLLILNQKQSALADSSSAISFSRAPDAAVQGLSRRDEAMTWQCIGRSMFDCDGEREKKSEEAAEEFRSMLANK